MRPFVVDHAVRPSRLRSSTASRTVAQGEACVPQFTGGQRVQSRRESPGSQARRPLYRLDLGAARPMPDGRGQAAPGLWAPRLRREAGPIGPPAWGVAGSVAVIVGGYAPSSVMTGASDPRTVPATTCLGDPRIEVQRAATG